MPYQSNADLPQSIQQHLPKHAQDIYRAAFNHAFLEYQNPENRHNPSESLDAVCSRVAWAAVKKKYEKKSDGTWHPL